VDTPQFYSRVFKKDYAIGVNQTGSSLDADCASNSFASAGLQ
jgi:hypothetical protein